MAEDGFKIADAYVSVVADIDESAVDASAKDTGRRAGDTLGDETTKSYSRRLRNDRGRFIASGEEGGRETSKGIGRGIFSSSPAIGSALSMSLTNPYVLGVIGVAGVALAPALMAGIAGGVMLGAGAGVLGLGYAIVKEEPAVKKASERLGKTVTSIFKSAAKPMIQPFAQAFGLVEGMMKRLEPSFKQMFKNMAPAIVPLTKGFTGLVEKAMPGIVKLVDAASKMMIELAPSFEKIGEGISFFSNEIAKAGPDATLFFKDLFTYIGMTIANLGILIGWVARGYGEFRRFFTSIGPWVVTAWNATSNFFTSVGNWFTMIGGKIMVGYNAFLNFFRSIGAAVSSWSASLGAVFASIPGRVSAFLSALPGNVINIFKTALNGALFAVGYGIGLVMRYFIELPGRARAALSTLWAFMSGAWNAARTGAINAANALVTGAANFIRQLPGRARSAVASLWSNMVGAFNSARSGAANSAMSIVNGAINFLRTLPSRAASAVSDVRNAIMGAFAGAAGWLVGAGAAILQGLAGGIRSAVGAAVGAAQDAVSSVISGAKSALGINSPSKVARREVGRHFMPGLVLGVKDTLPKTRRAIVDATRSLVPTVSGAAGNGRVGPSLTTSAGTTYQFAQGSIVLDASKLRTIQDVIDLVNRISPTARTAYAR